MVVKTLRPTVKTFEHYNKVTQQTEIEVCIVTPEGTTVTWGKGTKEELDKVFEMIGQARRWLENEGNFDL